MKLFSLTLVFFFLFSAHTAAISQEDAQKDFQVMNAIFTQAHAVAFRQIPKGDPPKLFGELTEVSTREFIKRILKYYKGLKVDHTGLGFAPELVEQLTLKQAIFPFPLKFFSGRAYFDCETAEIPFGSELLSVSGQTIEQLLNRIEDFAKVRVSPKTWDDYRLTENFSFMLYLLLGPPGEWAITIKVPGETAARKLRFDTVLLAKVQSIARRSAQARQYNQPLYTMLNPQLKVAYLAINTFMPTDGVLDSIESWNNYLNAFNQEAINHKAENLVIDLRQNRGGVMIFSAVAAQWFLSARLADESHSSTRARMLPYRELIASINAQPATPAQLKMVEDHLQATYSQSQSEGHFPLQKKDARYLKLEPVPVAHKYKRIFVLTGPATYSAAVNFARSVKLAGTNVTVVGSETGSAGDGHTADFLVSYKLPRTRLLIEVPLVKVDFLPTVPGQASERGLIPDVAASSTIEDFLSGKDTELAAVGAIILKP